MAFMIRPGQGFTRFEILHKSTTRSKAGGVGKSVYSEYEGELIGICTSTSPKEREIWKQDGHEVSNKIVQYYGQLAKKGQVLKAENPETGEVSLYFIETIKNPANLDHFTIYYVNKRDDLKYE